MMIGYHLVTQRAQIVYLSIAKAVNRMPIKPSKIQQEESTQGSPLRQRVSHSPVKETAISATPLTMIARTGTSSCHDLQRGLISQILQGLH